MRRRCLPKTGRNLLWGALPHVGGGQAGEAICIASRAWARTGVVWKAAFPACPVHPVLCDPREKSTTTDKGIFFLWGHKRLPTAPIPKL